MQSQQPRKDGRKPLPDIVSEETRSRMMSGIRGKDTKPEILIRKALHARGFRYRLHSTGIPGKPDIALPSRRAAIFINGCFWHGHDCHLYRLPSTRPEFWQTKIDRNRARDELVRAQLVAKGWRHLTIWECAIRGPTRIGINETIERTHRWIQSTTGSSEIRGVA
ncbi:very short patch repair endonuclease [Mesorhizobium sp. B3-1-6]|uniref:very short patch repair endonuclease n=1 Tax=Mesorhizobium sp. B3-1-6 TaxID=2589895 RepID=UPI0032B11185